MIVKIKFIEDTFPRKNVVIGNVVGAKTSGNFLLVELQAVERVSEIRVFNLEEVESYITGGNDAAAGETGS